MDEGTTRDETIADETTAEGVGDGAPAAQAAPVPANAKPRKKSGPRQILLFAVLLALVGLWVASLVDVYLLKSAVAEAAEGEIDELMADFNITGSDDDLFRIATDVTPSRKYAGFKESFPPNPNDEVLNTLTLGFLFGKPSAKMTVYIEDRHWDDANEGGGRAHGPAKIIGYDYFYTKKDGVWSFLENSRCSSQQCQDLGAKAFAKLDRAKK